MGTHPTFSPSTGPAAAYQPKTTDQSDASVAGTVLPNVIVDAGEYHMGAVGGEGGHVTAAAVATALTYTAGKCIGGIVTVANFSRIAGKSVLIQSATLRVLDLISSGEIDVVIFRGPPTVTTGLVDAAAFNVADADVPLVSKILKFVTFDAVSTKAVVSNLDGVGKYMGLSSGTTAYLIFVARSSITFAAAGDLTVGLGLILD